MSPLVAPLVSLLLFSGFVAAQVVAPDCSLTWGWTFNSLDQNACTVAAYLMSTCNGGSFTINSLQPGYSYTGPSGIDDSNLCKCNTVAYSLISACDACQGAQWITWSEYMFNCTKVLPPSSFPNPIPSGTRVPQWALLDVTSENNWNSNKSYAVGDSPELAPGAVLASGATVSASATGPVSPHSTSPRESSSTTPAPTHTGSSSNAGAIAGGVVGGVAAISIAVAAIFFFLRRQQPQAPSAAVPGVGPFQPPMDEIQRPLTDNETYTAYTASSVPASSLPGTPVVPMRLYDPSDPTTFPGYQGIPQSPATPEGALPSHSGTGNSLATMQTSGPQGYHGLPTV
ncbi:hypothetical protein DFH94DRAFT_782747 [Russula ochroleuca]|uniref:Transmembrane protein n=1 Tax=Russula ochroleuca TaxID=152965 RepID=A0A9P5JWG6_9AGAM|nr:hypothetical protein DFH94DRAFT_782747 [Russula ochroleuca]